MDIKRIYPRIVLAIAIGILIFQVSLNPLSFVPKLDYTQTLVLSETNDYIEFQFNLIPLDTASSSTFKKTIKTEGTIDSRPFTELDTPGIGSINNPFPLQENIWFDADINLDSNLNLIVNSQSDHEHGVAFSRDYYVQEPTAKCKVTSSSLNDQWRPRLTCEFEAVISCPLEISNYGDCRLRGLNQISFTTKILKVDVEPPQNNTIPPEPKPKFDISILLVIGFFIFLTFMIIKRNKK